MADPEREPASRTLAAELTLLFEATRELAPEARAATLMDWVLERIDASRCALVPFEGGAPGSPLAIRLRSGRGLSPHPRNVPRGILSHVARTRQPLISHDVADPLNELPPDASVIHQQVRSYMAIPVVFHGDLLAVCYVDRFDRPRDFGAEEQASFETFAYELAAPLLDLRAVERRRQYRELQESLREQEPQLSGLRLLTSSPALEPVLERARSLARHPEVSLLILGETGVGKEVVAELIHVESGRRGPFLPVNVSAVGPELFESELMGSVRGAFTGAVDRGGWATAAEGGTLFLDEIGDLALQGQVKLLRFLQDRRVRPVGTAASRVVDVRVVAATNRPLDRLLASGEFRRDLYHRFAPPLHVPPLRERREEILPHAQRWLRSRARQKGMRVPEFGAAAAEMLLSCRWPGNVRQLEMVLSHALLLAPGPSIDADLLAPLLAGDDDVPPPAAGDPRAAGRWPEWQEQRMREERAWLEHHLARNGGNVEATARAIDCPASTLRSTLARHGLPGPRPGRP